MNHWAFVMAAYVVVILGTVGLAVTSWLAMRRAEAAAEAIGRGRE